MFKPSAIQPAVDEKAESKADTVSDVIKTHTEPQSVKDEPIQAKETQENVEETLQTTISLGINKHISDVSYFAFLNGLFCCQR